MSTDEPNEHDIRGRLLMDMSTDICKARNEYDGENDGDFDDYMAARVLVALENGGAHVVCPQALEAARLRAEVAALTAERDEAVAAARGYTFGDRLQNIIDENLGPIPTTPPDGLLTHLEAQLFERRKEDAEREDYLRDLHRDLETARTERDAARAEVAALTAERDEARGELRHAIDARNYWHKKYVDETGGE